MRRYIFHNNEQTSNSDNNNSTNNKSNNKNNNNDKDKNKDKDKDNSFPPLHANWTVLELGCGNSTLAEELYDAQYFQSIIAIDYSPTVIEFMQKRLISKQQQQQQQQQQGIHGTYRILLLLLLYPWRD